MPKIPRRGSIRIPPLMTQDSVTSDIMSNMVVIAGLGHRIAFFVPPTSDKTPSLFSCPVPWTVSMKDKTGFLIPFSIISALKENSCEVSGRTMLSFSATYSLD